MYKISERNKKYFVLCIRESKRGEIKGKLLKNNILYFQN